MNNTKLGLTLSFQTVSAFKTVPTLQIRMGLGVPSPELYSSHSQKSRVYHIFTRDDYRALHVPASPTSCTVFGQARNCYFFVVQTACQSRTCCGMPFTNMTIPAVCCSSLVTK